MAKALSHRSMLVILRHQAEDGRRIVRPSSVLPRIFGRPGGVLTSLSNLLGSLVVFLHSIHIIPLLLPLTSLLV